jgi:hypothetical protein
MGKLAEDPPSGAQAFFCNAKKLGKELTSITQEERLVEVRHELLWRYDRDQRLMDVPPKDCNLPQLIGWYVLEFNRGIPCRCFNNRIVNILEPS